MVRLVKILFPYILYALVSHSLLGAEGPHIDTMPGSLDEHIRTMQCIVEGNQFAPPVIVIGSNDRLLFSFDHLSSDRNYFRYRLTHCNANWQPSQLIESEYLYGFNEATVDYYDFSRGTTVDYVHYSFAIPNRDMQPLLSGNYLVTLYDEDDPETPLARWRFMVSEQSATIDSEITSRTDIDYNSEHQQLALRVDTEHSSVTDPFNDLIVMIQQNGRLDNEVAIRHPLRMSGSTAIYEHQTPLIFEASNEYRRFETVSIDYPGMRIASVGYLDPYYHADIETDFARTGQPYSYDSTQNGRFTIREYDSDEADTRADYVVVHFYLEMPELPSTSIFIDGDLTSRRFDAESRMTYNSAMGGYQKAMLLKQGSYNYQYLGVPPGAKRGYSSTIEGNYYQTVNEYLIKVYTRQSGDRYDRLIGVSSIKFDR